MKSYLCNFKCIFIRLWLKKNGGFVGNIWYLCKVPSSIIIYIVKNINW